MSLSMKRCVVATACFGALSASMVYPAWAAIQQSQAYGGYVDIALAALDVPSTVIAGGEVSMSVRISNQGPESADFPQIVFTPHGSLSPSATIGCQNSPLANVRCHVPAPLAPGESRDATFIGVLDPSARGLLPISAFGMSEAIDVTPGNEKVIAIAQIRGSVDLEVRALNSVPEIDPTGGLMWTMTVTNTGISDSLQPNISPSSFPSSGAPIECTAIGARARCPGHPSGALIGIGETLQYVFRMPPLSERNPSVDVALFAFPQANDEFETDAGDNSVFLAYTDALFRDDFDF